MDIASFELFLTVARLQSISKAAQALFLAQSTVTHRLKQLEKRLGVTLFIRTASGVSLTPDGKRFLPIATSTVEQMRHFRQQHTEQQTMTIVAGKAFASYELPRLLSAYRREHPDFTCYVRSTLYEESITALLTGSADLAFLGSEVYHPLLQQTFLPSDRILLTLSPQHPWSDTFPGFAAWGQQEVVAFGSMHAPFRQRVDRFLAENGIFPYVIMELDSFSAVKQMVMENLGVTFLPERTIQAEVASGRLVAHDIAAGTLLRPTLLAYHRDKKQLPAFQKLIAWIMRHY